MAYIVGILTEKEEATLIRRGWEIEIPPAGMITDVDGSDHKRARMVFVDSNMFEIMSGADWDKTESEDDNDE